MHLPAFYQIPVRNVQGVTYIDKLSGNCNLTLYFPSALRVSFSPSFWFFINLRGLGAARTSFQKKMPEIFLKKKTVRIYDATNGNQNSLAALSLALYFPQKLM